ncbi:MAG: RsmB/NOP family class I SAM-dependent RNA methyltransferase, partial [Sphingobacterium composti]
ENKQMGSSDRKMTSRFIYNYFRLGNALKSESVFSRLIYAEFLCESISPLVTIHKEELAKHLTKPLLEKVDILKSYIGFDVNDVFPLHESLSTDLIKEKFVCSHFIQPDLFIRIKRGNESEVLSALEAKEFPYKLINTNTLALPNGFRLQDFPKLAGKFEVQDLSSQHTIDFMKSSSNENWWDACAASGGKALMFLDKYPSAKLLVSDIRLSILRNLNERFDKASVHAPSRQKVLDLTNDTSIILGKEEFDGIILDVPCSGSGTWGRTPEMLQQITAEKLEEFSELQKRIASNVVKHLKIGKPLVYITCSVYKKENEEVVQYLVDQFQFEIEKVELIRGYENKADSMFAARLIRKN